MRKSTTAIALALLWAPANHAFPLQQSSTSSSTSRGVLATSSPFPITTVLSSSSTDANAFLESEENSSLFQDWEALDRKNVSRKKFGLKPMTVAEFVAHEATVQQMALEQQQKQRDLAAAAAAQQQSQQEQQKQKQQSSFVPSFIEKMMDQVLPDQCESNWDCERPKICCDFGAAKVCCAGGSKQRAGGGVQGQLELIPVPLGRPQGPAEY